MDQMTAYSIEDLVSQTGPGGTTLAEVLSSRLSADEMDELQRDLARRMAENYRNIEGFMADVDVPSIADLSDMSASDLDDIQGEILAALSDEALAAHS